MSKLTNEWYEAEKEDIFLDSYEKRVNILVKEGVSGNVYTTITYKQIAEISKQIQDEATK